MVKIENNILIKKENVLFTITPPSEFKTVPWKNGKGETIELAISAGGTLEKFDWRLSIASVIEDGLFSDFSGYYRNLVLISGNGITLDHHKAGADRLESLLSVARFSGKNKTTGFLLNGPITDFNVIADVNQYQSNVKAFTEQSQVLISNQYLSFCYGLSHDLIIINDGVETIVKPGELLRIDSVTKKGQRPCELKVLSKNFILIELRLLPINNKA